MGVNTRRTFLKSSAKATFLFTLFNPFVRLFSQNRTGQLPTWKELVEYARWCPNVHNLQPHRLKIISDTEAELYYDPTRLLPVGDPHSIFVTVAMGIFIEHLAIAAAPYGAKVTITEVLDPITITATSNTLFAKLKIQFTPDKEELDRELMTKRRTSRLHYNGVPLKTGTLDKMKKQSTELGHDFFFSSENDLIDFIIDLNQQTLFKDLESEADREELNKLFRYSKKEAETKKDGLWSKCMGFSGSLMKSVFQHHEKWEKGVRKNILSSYYIHSFKGTATICWCSGKFSEPMDWLNSGKMIARNWLLLTRDGAYMHPMGSLITNTEACKKINDKLAQPGSDQQIWMIFRAGYSDEPARSYRLSTDELIIK